MFNERETLFIEGSGHIKLRQMSDIKHITLLILIKVNNELHL